MKALIQTGFGAADEVLSVAEIERPSTGPTDVLVRVHAVGINKGAWLCTHGLPYIARPAYGIRKPKEPVAGYQFAGTIAGLGAQVEGLSIGEPVFGFKTGSLAEFIATSAESLVRKPDAITMEQAAAAPISGMAALQAVRDGGRVRPGHRVLVIGASGGVGSMVVQIAKAFGATVTGVASTRNLEMVRDLGADHVIDYRQTDPTAGRPGYDVIIDLAGNRSVSRLRSALAPEGALIIVGGSGGRWTMGFGRTVGAMLLARFVRHRIVGLLSTPNHADLRILAEMVGNGQLTPVVQPPYSLERAAEAIEAVGAGKASGTLVVTI
ncbi:MAG: NAD(P)-dependent alcohol dehydrogenase [Gemmatimonadales bacterium]